MKISDAILPEFDHEMANTRKTLERVPEDKWTWKPHPKSFSMGDLASHLATIADWTVDIVNKDEFDYAPPGGEPMKFTALKSRQELLDALDKGVAAAREAIAGSDNEHLMKEWRFLGDGQLIFALPRAACIRSFVMNHNVHHRAQLGVYLRMNDVPVPAIYGPSADEAGV